MAEKSIFWTTGATGDGATEYTQAELIRWMRQMWLADNTDEGVHKNYLNELEVTGTSTPVAVNTGAAIVYGFPYWNTASVDVAIPTPSAATRIDYITLEADWTAQTVRITRVAGTEGAGAPSLTQSDGSEWQIPLAQASITTGGVITVTDARVWVHPNIEVETANIADEAVTAAKIDNRTRTLFVPATAGYNNTDAISLTYASRGFQLADNKSCECRGHFVVPKDFASGMTIKAIVSAAVASGNIYATNVATYGALDEAIDTHTAGSGYSATAIVGDEWDAINNESLASAAVDDVVNVYCIRNATHASDTVSAVVYFVGWLVEYTADS